MSIKILLVEDDTIIADFIQVVLKREKYDVLWADSALKGLTLLRDHPIDLILLDLGLPDMDGIEWLKIVRKEYSMPVIIISARDNEEGKVEALDIGADDYVTKPFGTQELMARIRTALRHSKSEPQKKQVIVSNELVIDNEKHEVLKGGTNIHLTKNEFLLIQVLATNLGKVVTYKQLMYALYGQYATGDPQVLRVNMSNIRKKLEDVPVEPKYIITEIGIGYRLKSEN